MSHILEVNFVCNTSRPNSLTSAWGSWNRTLLWLRTGVGAWKSDIVRTNISKLTLLFLALPGSLARMKIVSVVFQGRLHCSEVVVPERKVLTATFTAKSQYFTWVLGAWNL